MNTYDSFCYRLKDFGEISKYLEEVSLIICKVLKYFFKCKWREWFIFAGGRCSSFNIIFLIDTTLSYYPLQYFYFFPHSSFKISQGYFPLTVVFSHIVLEKRMNYKGRLWKKIVIIFLRVVLIQTYDLFPFPLIFEWIRRVSRTKSLLEDDFYLLFLKGWMGYGDEFW